MTQDLFSKFEPIWDEYQSLPTDGTNPFNVSMEKVLSPTEAIINGKKVILAGTNNYMGMTFNEECIKAAKDAVDEYGTGTTGSRVLNGTYDSHRKLEAALCEFYDVKYGIVFSTGYQANLGVISTLCQKNDYVLIDQDNHASIYDACSMGEATIVRFRHNSPESLENRFKKIRDEDPDAGVLVVVEGVYSMLGDQAPLKEFAEITKKYNGYILVDEAHSIGVFGKTGRGVAQAQGVEHMIDFIVGTFSKSVGTIGGYCVSNNDMFESLRLVCRPYLFTASLPPSVVASAIKALEIIATTNLREKLLNNTRRLNEGLRKAGFEVATAGEGPIAAIVVDTRDRAFAFWGGMINAGVYVNLAIPPSTPKRLNLMRCSLSASHSFEQIDFMLEAFKKSGKKFGVI